MFKFVILLALVSCVFAGERYLLPIDKLDGRIMGGTNADIANFRWQVSLQNTAGTHFCGGSIISANWVLTAAHCLIGIAAPTIRIRSQSSQSGAGGTLHQASKIILHPQFNPGTYNNDAALIQALASTPFPANSAIPLFTLGQSIAVGTSAIVTGWGALWEGGPGSTTLQQLAVPIIADAACNTMYGGGITENMICAGFTAGGKDACQGDSGGPLAYNGRLVGIVSWGKGCGRPNLPGVYARISATSIRNFVSQNAGI